MRATRLFCSVLAVILPLLCFAQQELKLGSLAYKIPADWKVEQKNNSAQLTSSDQKLEGATISLFADEALTGSLEDYFNKRWESIRAGRTIAATAPTEKFKDETGEGMVKVAAYAADHLEMLMVLGVSGRSITIHSKFKNEEQFNLVQEILTKLLDEVVFGEIAVGRPQNNLPASTTQAQDPNSPIVQPLDIDITEPLPISARLTPGVPVEQEARRLAKEYMADPAKRVEILTLAIRASGYNIREFDKKMIAPALTVKPNGIYFLKGDVSAYAAMSAQGQTFAFGMVAEALEWGAYRNPIGISDKFSNMFLESVQKGLYSPNPGKKFHATFVTELYRLSSGGPQFFDPGSWKIVGSDPAIILLLLHPFAQEFRQLCLFMADLTKPVKKAATFRTTQDLYATVRPIAPIAPVQAISSGTAEDGWVGTANTIFENSAPQLIDRTIDTIIQSSPLVNGKLSDTAMSALKKLAGFEMYMKAAAFANAVNAVVKFISTYACMKTKFEVIDAEPLERTKRADEWKEVKRVRATVTIETSKVQNWMKAIRPYLAPLGLDLDQPPSGPVEGVVNWTMLDRQPPVVYKSTEKYGIRGYKTDSNGQIEIDVQGRPQAKDMSKNNPAPYIRKVPIGFTIAVKPPNMAQDVTDALAGALPFVLPIAKAGGKVLPVQPGSAADAIPFLGPIMETLYRYDWAYQGFMLQVKDWAYEVALLDIGINTEGTANLGTRKIKVNRSLNFVQESGEFPGVKFRSTGVAQNNLPNRPAGMVVNEYAPENGSVALALRISDEEREKKMIFIGDCVDGKDVLLEDTETWQAPVTDQYRKSDVSNGIRLYMGNEGTNWKSWLKLGGLPTVKTRITSKYQSQTFRNISWPESQLQDSLNMIELPMEVKEVVSYPAEGNDPAFGIAIFGGKVTPNILAKVHDISTFSTVFYNIVVIEASGGTIDEIASRWYGFRHLARTGIHSALDMRIAMIRNDEEWNRQLDRDLDPATCLPTKATILIPPKAVGGRK